MKKVAFHTLGCKLNFAESSSLLKTFLDNNYLQVSFKEVADVYIINTCSVTQVAEKKSKAAIRQANKLNPSAIIAVVGCFSQLRPNEIAEIDGVDIILGNKDKHKLFEYIHNHKLEHYKSIDIGSYFDLNEFVPSFSSSDRTRSFLKVQDGCDYFCAYCTIPFARGRSRSDTIEHTIEKARQLGQEGKKEIVLTGVNIGDFGKGNNETFLQLIEALDRVEGVERYRISSIEPNLITREIIDFVKQSNKFLPHFHIPLQGGTDNLLSKMKRKYNTSLFRERVEYINSVMPHSFIAADVIIGFSSETMQEFESSKEFIESLPISALHVFTYSERPNTLSLTFDGKVPNMERKRRSLIMQSLSEEKKKEFYKRHIGYKARVLWESDNEKGIMYGFTDNYIRVGRNYNEKYINLITEEILQNLSQDSEYFFIND